METLVGPGTSNARTILVHHSGPGATTQSSPLPPTIEETKAVQLCRDSSQGLGPKDGNVTAGQSNSQVSGDDAPREDCAYGRLSLRKRRRQSSRWLNPTYAFVQGHDGLVKIY